MQQGIKFSIEIEDRFIIRHDYDCAKYLVD